MSKQLSAEILHKHCSHLFYKDDPDLLFVYKAMQEYADARLIAAQERIKQLEDALTIVQKWQLPSTGQFWDDDKTRPMSYGVCYGSNGERDFMRKVANEALTPNNKQKEDEQ